MEENCQICGRALKPGPSIDEHHLVPKTYGGKETVLIHKICHQKIHSLFDEKQLRDKYNTITSLINNDDMRSFIKWVRKKPIDFIDKNIQSNKRRKNYR